VVFAALKAGGFLQPSVIWLDSILVAARFGFAGAIAGTAFSALIGLLYRGWRPGVDRGRGSGAAPARAVNHE
jgi:hypothetical protein